MMRAFYFYFYFCCFDVSMRIGILINFSCFRVLCLVSYFGDGYFVKKEPVNLAMGLLLGYQTSWEKSNSSHRSYQRF